MTTPLVGSCELERALNLFREATRGSDDYSGLIDAETLCSQSPNTAKGKELVDLFNTRGFCLENRMGAYLIKNRAKMSQSDQERVIAICYIYSTIMRKDIQRDFRPRHTMGIDQHQNQNFRRISQSLFASFGRDFVVSYLSRLPQKNLPLARLEIPEPSQQRDDLQEDCYAFYCALGEGNLDKLKSIWGKIKSQPSWKDCLGKDQVIEIVINGDQLPNKHQILSWLIELGDDFVDLDTMTNRIIIELIRSRDMASYTSTLALLEQAATSRGKDLFNANFVRLHFRYFLTLSLTLEQPNLEISRALLEKMKALNDMDKLLIFRDLVKGDKTSREALEFFDRDIFPIDDFTCFDNLFDRAIEAGRVQTVDFLMQKSSGISEEQQKSYFSKMVEKGHCDLLRYFFGKQLFKQPLDVETALTTAIKTENPEMLELLLQNPQISPERKQSLMMEYAANKQPGVIKVCLESQKSDLSFIREFSAQVLRGAIRGQLREPRETARLVLPYAEQIPKEDIEQLFQESLEQNNFEIAQAFLNRMETQEALDHALLEGLKKRQLGFVEALLSTKNISRAALREAFKHTMVNPVLSHQSAECNTIADMLLKKADL